MRRPPKARTLHERTVALRRRGRRALAAFLVAGYPDLDAFEDLLLAADEAGTDVLEIGVPFSDPIADGPTLQRAHASALREGVTLARVFERIVDLAPRLSAAPVVMGYVNPILALGIERTAQAAAEAGVLGFIVPDVPIEESERLRPVLAAHQIEWVDLVAPTTPEPRIDLVVSKARGFVYLVAVTGVTGPRSGPPRGLERLAGRVRARTETPVYAGFGIAGPDQARLAARAADGVVVGSRLAAEIERGRRSSAPDRVARTLRAFRAALDEEEAP